MQCGLLGEKLQHSYSPQIHSYLADYVYTLFEKQPHEVGAFLQTGDFTGINITIPYKKTVVPYCGSLSPCAKVLGSVNTIVKQNDGTLFGHNTDYFGFTYLLKYTGIVVTDKKVLVLGSGGSSVTVCAVLRDLGANVVVISRTGENNYQNIAKHVDASVIVNTTPVGMYPNNGVSPIDLSIFSNLEGVIDIIYNPAKTRLLLDAEAKGIIAVNGLRMLIAQAKESAELFSGKRIDDTVIEEIYNKLQRLTENVILIGMPGCGKSTVGKKLADLLGKTFIDADNEIAKAAGIPIPEIFHQKGETGFRDTESCILSELGKRSGCVIATGGGCVTREENYSALHQNGIVIWLQRNIAQLPTEGRPLSKVIDLHAMYQVRHPLYQRFADICIANTDTPDITAASIYKLLMGETDL